MLTAWANNGHWEADFAGGYQKIKQIELYCTNGECAKRMNKVEVKI